MAEPTIPFYKTLRFSRSSGTGSRVLVWLISTALACVAVATASAFEPLLDTSIRSHSGQFTVQSVPRPSLTNSVPKRVSVAGGWAFVVMPPAAPTSDELEQTLDPALLVTSCERIKFAVLTELQIPDRWRGRIDLNINRSLARDSEPILRIAQAPGGWRYELELPVAIKPRHLSRTLVTVVLLELANRTASAESTQLPFWLVEGMMAQIRANDYTLLLRPNISTMNSMLLDDQKTPLFMLAASHRSILDPQISARLQRLGSRNPLTFQELSWPTHDQVAGNDEEHYQASAHLFLYKLFKLNEGRAALCRFLELLPAHLNWQVSFLEAYSSEFKQLRDIEKWWTLTRVDAPGSNATRWSALDSAKRFLEILEIPVQVRSKADEIPGAGRTTLQEVILRWDAATQFPALQKVSADLVTLRPRVSPEFLPLVDRYSRIIETFLKENSPEALAWMRANGAPKRARESTARQLADADKQLADLQSQLATVAASK